MSRQTRAQTMFVKQLMATTTSTGEESEWQYNSINIIQPITSYASSVLATIGAAASKRATPKTRASSLIKNRETFKFVLMGHSFPELLRKSRLATFDPAIPQVYKTYGPFKKRGDWGLKRNLPNILRTDVITVKALDTVEHQTDFKSARSLVGFARKWKELFKISKPPPPMKENLEKNITRMSRQEFGNFLKEVEKRKGEWDALREKPIDVLGFVNATDDINPTPVCGLTYSNCSPGTNVQVQGRILNKDASLTGYAVGLAGIVAYLPTRKSNRISSIDHQKVFNFFVEKAEFDAQGKPNIQLSQIPPYSMYNNLGFLEPGEKKTSFFESASIGKRWSVNNRYQVSQVLLDKLSVLIKQGTSSASIMDDEEKQEKQENKHEKTENDFLSILGRSKNNNSI
ncbi:979_t:CDS:2 [Ambispora gerdemannii]|uniref:979_t:CDS:1 n=1 Tax=Ambispora gerdemannii TaxID=144530 RepID=A0A9N9AQX7_9GLOM|nr:979_t:CDS:2 [Ambispora gerdemannii]